MKQYFIATAMSDLSKKDYKSLQKTLKKIQKKHKDIKIFSEITNIKNQNKFQSPKKATQNDINQIKKSSKFILLHLSKVQSSTLFELGIAYQLNKKIKIIYKNKSDLPFMLKELNKVNKNVKLIKINNLKDIKNAI